MRACYRRVQTWWEQSVQTSSRSKRGRLEQSSGERLLEDSEDNLSEQEQQPKQVDSLKFAVPRPHRRLMARAIMAILKSMPVGWSRSRRIVPVLARHVVCK